MVGLDGRAMILVQSGLQRALSTCSKQKNVNMCSLISGVAIETWSAEAVKASSVR